jgi:hypothetical protein
LTRKVGVRFNEKTYQHLLYLVENTNSQSVGELVRRIVVKEKILFFRRRQHDAGANDRPGRHPRGAQTYRDEY